MKGQEQLTGDEQMIDANGGGSFANIDRRSGFSVPSSHQSVKQTTSQETNIQPADEAEQTKSAGAGSRANATVQIRQRAMLARFGRECWIGRAAGVERLDLRQDQTRWRLSRKRPPR